MRIDRTVEPFGLTGDRHDLVFTSAERTALRRATEIISEARRLCEATFGPEWVDSDSDEILGHAEHACADIDLDAGRVEVWVETA